MISHRSLPSSRRRTRNDDVLAEDSSIGAFVDVFEMVENADQFVIT